MEGSAIICHLFWLSTYSTLLGKGYGDIHVGGAVNIFSNFGNLGSVVKVNPHYNTNWFIDQDAIDIFEEVFETRSPILHLDDAVFNGDFNLELCDNLAQLKQAYFKSYKIDRSEKPWQVFTGSWSNSVTAIHLGLNASYLNGEYGYVLVRLTRKHQLVTLTPNMGLRLNNWTAKHIEQLVPGQANSVLEFIRASGSHYVSSYTTGDSLYQVFVFTSDVYSELHKEMRAYDAGTAGMDRILTFFTPWNVEHMGRIQSTSGNNTLEQWATLNLQSRVYMFVYSSLLNLHSAQELLHELNYLLGNNALLSVELKSLAPLFIDDQKKLWFEEVLDNHLKLWELSV